MSCSKVTDVTRTLGNHHGIYKVLVAPCALSKAYLRTILQATTPLITESILLHHISVPLTSRPALAHHPGKLLTTGNFQNCFFTAGGLCKGGESEAAGIAARSWRLFPSTFPSGCFSLSPDNISCTTGLEKGCVVTISQGRYLSHSKPKPCSASITHVGPVFFLIRNNWRELTRNPHVKSVHNPIS